MLGQAGFCLHDHDSRSTKNNHYDDSSSPFLQLADYDHISDCRDNYKHEDR
jgi:hypothetical protein